MNYISKSNFSSQFSTALWWYIFWICMWPISSWCIRPRSGQEL